MAVKYSIDDIIGESDVMKGLKKSIVDAAKIDSHILINGESGTGKELVAHAIAKIALKNNDDFTVTNAAVMTKFAAHFDLFGVNHPNKKSLGRLGRLHKGLLVIDHINELPLDLLSEIKLYIKNINSSIHLIGIYTNTYKSDDLPPFLYDLFKVKIKTPALRDHKEDIPALIEYKMERLHEDLGLRIIENNKLKKIYYLLQTKEWPGNVRELFNVVEYFYLNSNNELIWFEEYINKM